MSCCFLLTAGQGSRLRPYTEKVIKPRLPFLNTPLAYFGLYLALEGGFKNFLLNKHHLPFQVDQLAKDILPLVDSVDISDESQALLGSGGALWKAKHFLSDHDSFLVANGDEVLIPPHSGVLQQLYEKHIQSGALCTLLTCDHPDLLKSLKPVWVDSSGHVKAFGMESPNSQWRPVHYTGYKVFSKRIFDYLPDGESNIFYETVTQAIAQGEKVSTLHLKQASWYETGNFDSFLDAQKQVMAKHLPYLAKLRGRLGLPPLIIRQRKDATLVSLDDYQDTFDFKGLVVLGRNVSIGSPVHLEDVVIGSQKIVEDSASLTHTMLV